MNWFKIAKTGEIPHRKLGKTGYDVSIFSLGGQGSLETQGSEKNSIKIIQKAYELGINYFDTSPIYGPSEDYYGKALKGFRKNIFLASKTDKRDRDGALKDIENSLKRLNTDYLDLWQIHHLENNKEVNQVAGKNGALEAIIEMKEQGVVKHCGLTGHEDPNILLNMMSKHDFDTVLCPINAADVHMKPSFIADLIPVAQEKNMGIIGMKVFSQGFIFHPKGIRDSGEALRYALNIDGVSTIIVGHDTVEQLEKNVEVAKNYNQLQFEDMSLIENKTKKYLRRASFFRKEFGGYDSKEKLGKPFKI